MGTKNFNMKFNVGNPALHGSGNLLHISLFLLHTETNFQNQLFI